MKIETGVLRTHDKKVTGKKKTPSGIKAKLIKARKAKLDKEKAIREETTDVREKLKYDKELIKDEIRTEMKEDINASFISLIEPSVKVDIGGVERERHDANILRLEWAIKFPMLTPQEYLLHEKDYSASQAHRIFEVSGGEAEWRGERDKLLNGVTDTMIKRNIDKMVENSETHMKLSQLVIAKVAEMLTKMQIDPVMDADGKLIIDPKSKRPVYRGFRSIDLVNCTTSLEKAVNIQRKILGMNDDVGIQQIQEAIRLGSNPITVNVQNNVNMTIEEAPKTKIEQICEKLEYEDLKELIKERRAMKSIIEVDPNNEQ